MSSAANMNKQAELALTFVFAKAKGMENQCFADDCGRFGFAFAVAIQLSWGPSQLLLYFLGGLEGNQKSCEASLRLWRFALVRY